MQRLQLYIEDHENNEILIDLFDNETIQLTSSIQDVKDIGKVFTDFSQTFSVPASETNNKVFRHFYNFNITGNAFDARKKKKAKLHINYMPFREGKIFLNSVKMKNNKAYAYEVIFYGKTVSLKDLIGDDELTDLDNLKFYNHEYSELNVRNGFTTGLNLNSQTNSIIYPLITSKKRLFFNSDDPVASDFFNSSGNLYCDESDLTNTSNNSLDRARGLQYTDLKPAIRAIHIIESIELKYNISFVKDTNGEFDKFFGSTAFSNLYLWLNSKKGELGDRDDNEDFAFHYTVTGYTSSSPSLNITIIESEKFTFNEIPYSTATFSLNIVVSDQNVEYEVILKNKTLNKEYRQSTIGNDTVGFIFSSLGTRQDTFEFEIKSKNALTIVSADFVLTSFPKLGQNEGTKTYSTSSNQPTTFEVNLISGESPVIPKMKVMDFLTGLFKMFNLTAYFIDDYGDTLNYGRIYVDTLDNYYADAVNNKLGGLIDIDKYLDASQHTVNSVLPFTDINFNYQETNTVLMENHELQFNEVFGDAEFNVREGTKNQTTGEYTVDRGTKYDIQLPFSHMKYERLLDLGINRGVNATTDTIIQYGYCAGGQFNADTDVTPPTGDYDKMSIKPLLFYAINVTGLPAASNANSNRSGKINWISSSPYSTNLDSYWRPSNANDNGNTSTPPTFSLNFDQEVDEFQGVNYGDDSNSLYKVFYKSYVESVFDPLKRMFKVKAFLPPNIVINYRLNDQIKIQDKIFRINSITTDLMTGESEMELLNIFSSEIVG